MLFGSWTMEHTLQRWCDNDDDPNGPTTTGQFNPTAATTGVDAPLGGRYCDQTQFDYPFIHEFKFAGNYTFPVRPRPRCGHAELWRPGTVIFMGARTGTVPERPAHAGPDVHPDRPGTIFYDRWNQLDMNVKKNFRHNNNVLTFQIDIFNVLNANAIARQQQRWRESRQRHDHHDGPLPAAGGELQVLTTKTRRHEARETRRDEDAKNQDTKGQGRTPPARFLPLLHLPSSVVCCVKGVSPDSMNPFDSDDFEPTIAVGPSVVQIRLLCARSSATTSW